MTHFFHSLLPPLNTRGQTLIEVLIATSVVVVVLTGLAASLSFTVKNSAEARYRALASTLAQEVTEVFRRERALNGWMAFSDSLTATAYCFNTLPATMSEFAQEPVVGGCDANEVFSPSGSATSFKREVSVTKAADQVSLTVVVSWQDTTKWNDVTVTETLRKL